MNRKTEGRNSASGLAVIKNHLETLRLINPCVDLRDEHAAMMLEWQATGERLVPYSLNYYSHKDFSDYVQRLHDGSRSVGLPGGFVAWSTFWLTNAKDTLLGCIDIRHQLNEQLLQEGGHIGFGIRPSRRRNGYGAMMLRLGLKEAQKLGLQKVLLTCDKTNVGSKRIILVNGGAFYEEGMFEGRPKLKYWIDIDEKSNDNGRCAI